MSTYKIAVIGDKDSILGFKTIGVETFSVTNSEAALAALKKIVAEEYGVVFITEELARDLQDIIGDLNRRFLPAVVLIPNSRGTLGLGIEQIRKNVEKAIGADILFKKEG